MHGFNNTTEMHDTFLTQNKLSQADLADALELAESTVSRHLRHPEERKLPGGFLHQRKKFNKVYTPRQKAMLQDQYAEDGLKFAKITDRMSSLPAVKQTLRLIFIPSADNSIPLAALDSPSDIPLAPIATVFSPAAEDTEILLGKALVGTLNRKLSTLPYPDVYIQAKPSLEMLDKFRPLFEKSAQEGDEDAAHYYARSVILPAIFEYLAGNLEASLSILQKLTTCLSNVQDRAAYIRCRVVVQALLLQKAERQYGKNSYVYGQRRTEFLKQIERAKFLTEGKHRSTDNYVHVEVGMSFAYNILGDQYFEQSSKHLKNALLVLKENDSYGAVRPITYLQAVETNLLYVLKNPDIEPLTVLDVVYRGAALFLQRQQQRYVQRLVYALKNHRNQKVCRHADWLKYVLSSSSQPDFDFTF